MIVKTLRSGSVVRQALLILLPVLTAMLPAYRRGVAIIQPEESSVIFMWLSQWIVTLPGYVQHLVLTLLIFLNILFIARVGKLIGIVKGKIPMQYFFATFVVLMLPSNVAIHPPLVAMLLFIPALISILSASGSRNSGVRIFNAGFLLSVATLVAHPLLLMIPGFFLVLMASRFYRWNYWAMLASGLALPWIYVVALGWVFSWYPGPGLYAATGIYLSGIKYFAEFLKASLPVSSVVAISAMAIMLIPAMFTIFSRLDQKVIAERYLYRAMLWLFLFAIPVMVVAGGSVQYLSFAGFFVVILLSEYILTLRRTLIVDIILGVMLIIGIFGHLHLF
ncbi:MAG: hypothetical protein R6V49_07840 [Bacteroidales bacterium]